MVKNKLVNEFIEEIKKEYVKIDNIYISDSFDKEGIDIIIDNKEVFNSLSYSRYIYEHSIEDKESGKFINFLFVDPLVEKEYIKTLKCVFSRKKEYVSESEEFYDDIKEKFQYINLNTLTLNNKKYIEYGNNYSLIEKFFEYVNLEKRNEYNLKIEGGLCKKTQVIIPIAA